MSNTLRWKRVALWHLGQREQVLFAADGRDVQYKITRAGTADKPTWTLYTRQCDGTERGEVESNLLRMVKAHAASMENRALANFQ